MRKLPIVYTFDDMITSLRRAMERFPDLRTGKNSQYEVMDAASGAFSVFFTQCPSFLSHQELLQQKYGLSNAKTLCSNFSSLFSTSSRVVNFPILKCNDIVSYDFNDKITQDYSTAIIKLRIPYQSRSASEIIEK